MSFGLRMSSVIALLVGCSDSMSAPPVGPDAGPVKPHVPVCEADACGLPGQDPCCDGTSCIDFHNFGSTQCVMECKADTDCPTGCCGPTTNGKRVCSPAEWCGTGGIYPEGLCFDADTCGLVSNQSVCVTQVENCLKPLDQSSLTQWFSAVDACYASSGTSCTNFSSCIRNLPFCRFE
jgi:hypothetical protein